DRSRRYDSASGLARDVERFLKHEPVEARPPSATYRLQKFLRRNRAAVLTTAIVAVAVVLGAAISVWQVVRAQNAEATLVAERRQYALERATEAAFSGDLAKARKAIIAAQKAGVEAHQVYWLQGLVHFQRGKFSDARKEFEASLEIKRTAAAMG